MFQSNVTMCGCCRCVGVTGEFRYLFDRIESVIMHARMQISLIFYEMEYHLRKSFDLNIDPSITG